MAAAMVVIHGQSRIAWKFRLVVWSAAVFSAWVAAAALVFSMLNAPDVALRDIRTEAELNSDGLLRIWRRFCLDRSMTMTIAREVIALQDSPFPRAGPVVEAREVIQIPDATIAEEAGCVSRVFLVQLPVTLQPGEYLFQSTVLFERHPLMTKGSQRLPAIKFTVAPKAASLDGGAALFRLSSAVPN